jgi:hypothetical protein
MNPWYFLSTENRPVHFIRCAIAMTTLAWCVTLGADETSGAGVLPDATADTSNELERHDMSDAGASAGHDPDSPIAPNTAADLTSASAAFDVADTDGDGRLSATEFNALQHDNGVLKPGKDDARDMNVFDGEGLPADPLQRDSLLEFDATDLDHDGYISRDELAQVNMLSR